MAHPLVDLARNTIDEYVKDKKVIDPPSGLTDEMKQRAGAFVSLHIGKSLRGCIGTFAPTRKNVAEEIIHNAIAACSKDPRFSPVRPDELASLDISVDVLSPPEKVDDISKLDAKKYGIIVQSGYRKGLLLPDLEGVDTPQHQIEICRMKGGIEENDPVELYRFTVNRYH